MYIYIELSIYSYIDTRTFSLLIIEHTCALLSCKYWYIHIVHTICHPDTHTKSLKSLSLHALYSVYYRDTAITLLRLIKKHNRLQTIKLCVRKKKKNEKIDPLTMLIKEMPGITYP